MRSMSSTIVTTSSEMKKGATCSLRMYLERIFTA